MPDQTQNPLAQGIKTPVKPAAPAQQGATTSPAPPLPIIPDVSQSPPPPPTPAVTVEEKKEAKKPKTDTEIEPPTGSKPADLNIPPVVASVGKGKGGSIGSKKKVIATILGLLLLVGAVGAGVILVKRNQDIRERADACMDDCLATGADYWLCEATCVMPTSAPTAAPTAVPPIPTAVPPLPTSVPPIPLPGPTCSQSSVNICGGECPIDERCTYFLGQYVCTEDSICSCIDDCWYQGPDPDYCNILCGGEPPDDDDNGNGTSCTNPGSNSYVGTTSGGISVQVTQEMVDYCICKGKSGKIKVSRFQCSGQTMPAGGCQQGGQITYFGPGSDNTALPDTQPMANDCGPQQLDVGCVGGGNIEWVSGLNWPATCGGGGNGGNGNGDNGDTSLTCRCEAVKVYDSEFNEIATADLSSLVAGDITNIAVFPYASSGENTQAKFIINGEETIVTTTTTVAGIEAFVLQYTIPEGVTSFTIEVELYHPDIGWY